MLLLDSLLFDNADFGVHSPTGWLTTFFALAGAWQPVMTGAGVLALVGLVMVLLGRGPVRQRGAVAFVAFWCNPTVLLGFWSLTTSFWDPRADLEAADVITVTAEEDGFTRTVVIGPGRFTHHQDLPGSGQAAEAEFPLDGPRRQFIQDSAERLLAPVAHGPEREGFTCLEDVHHDWTSWSVSVSGSREYHLSSEHCLPSGAESGHGDAEAAGAEAAGAEEHAVDVSWVWSMIDRVDSAQRAPLQRPATGCSNCWETSRRYVSWTCINSP